MSVEPNGPVLAGGAFYLRSRIHRSFIPYYQNRVDGEIRKIYSGLEQPQTAKLSMIRFTADPQMRPWFTDGERYLHPSQVAEELMEEVAKFFEDIAKRPLLIG